MSTVTGKLIGLPVTPAADATYSVDITLCGYGSRSPVARGQGSENGSYCSAELNGIVPNEAGNAIEVDLIGNDLIVPTGTYYTFVFKNGNGDILQINAYVFQDDTDYDLTNTDPFDPNQPPPPLPPLLTDNLVIVPSARAPEFDGGAGTAWKITLEEDATGAYLVDVRPGNLYTFIIVQDGVGGHLFYWPAGVPPATVHNAPYVNQDPNATTIQTFIADENSQLYPIGPATYYP